MMIKLTTYRNNIENVIHDDDNETEKKGENRMINGLQ